MGIVACLCAAGTAVKGIPVASGVIVGTNGTGGATAATACFGGGPLILC